MTDSRDVKGGQKAFLVGVQFPEEDAEDVENSIMELEGLAATAGAQVVGYEIQRREKPHGALFVGRGKALEIERRRAVEEFDVVIFNHELSPSRQRNLENVIQCPIIDRTALILDIFANRARTKESKLQVELAQLQYRLTRLSGKGVDLSRLGGGIGTRGPGQTKLEIDRRRIRDRIAAISRELEKIKSHRSLIRKRRVSNTVPVVALTGYTNAGKSTLHKILSFSRTYSDDRLFATLDANARRVEPPNGEPYILIDTVGFIRDLPPKLVAAFRSTLEEVVYSDVLLHVVDSSSRALEQEIETVEKILEDLEVLDRPKIMVFNKIDLIDSIENIEVYMEENPGSVSVSALNRTGIKKLNEAVQAEISKFREDIKIFIPYSKMNILDIIYRNGRVKKQESCEQGINVEAVLDPLSAKKIKKELGKG